MRNSVRGIWALKVYGAMSSQLAELQRALGRIEGKLDVPLGDDGRVARIEMAQGERHRRTGKTENRLHWRSGAGAVIGALAAWLGTWFAKHV